MECGVSLELLGEWTAVPCFQVKYFVCERRAVAAPVVSMFAVVEKLPPGCSNLVLPTVEGPD